MSYLYNYNRQVSDYHNNNVNLPEKVREKLRGHRSSNQNRIISNIRDGITVNRSSFVKQGSYAMRTTIQDIDNNYDIDDGVLLKKEELLGERGAEMTPLQVRDMISDAVKDDRFSKQPERLKNCVRVHYNEGHHVDIPCYRTYLDENDKEVIELASSEWKKSNPKEINEWFEKKRREFNESREGRGLQLRVMIRLLKRFCRSRPSWNMPSGLILTMLAVEKFPNYERNDECFYYLLKALKSRLDWDKTVKNMADKSWVFKEELTKTPEDSDIVFLHDKIKEALNNLEILESDKCEIEDARKAWDWVFKTDGYFDNYDEKDQSTEKNKSGLANSKPTECVDYQGGGRFG